MTNGEKIKTIFPNEEMYEQTPTMTYYGMMRFDTDWWNMEYKEPTTKHDLGVDCVSRQDVDRLACIYLKEATDDHVAFYENFLDLPSVTPQEPRIITCKDCTYYRNKGDKYSYCTKRLNVDSVTDRYREPNFYCADAVLRKVEE